MSEFRHLSVTDAARLIKQQNAAIADIRDPQSFALGHIPGATRLSDENIQQFMLEQDMDKPLIVVCYHGISSQGAARYLAEQGFDEVYSLDGGFTEWAEKEPTHVERG